MSEPTRKPVLQANALTARRGRREVLPEVDLTVHPGEIVAVLGPDGAGKSTLLTALAGGLTPSADKVKRAEQVALVLQTLASPADRRGRTSYSRWPGGGCHAATGEGAPTKRWR